jgi:hypothetical protein
MNPAPLLRLSGFLRSDVEFRDVEPYEGRDSYRDEDGKFHRAVAPRDGYAMGEVNVLTDDGGFVYVTVKDDQAALATDAGWSPPSKGERFENLPVRPYQMWVGPDGRRQQVIRLALAGDVLADELRKAAGSDKPAADKPALVRTGS